MFASNAIVERDPDTVQQALMGWRPSIHESPQHRNTRDRRESHGEFALGSVALLRSAGRKALEQGEFSPQASEAQGILRYDEKHR